MEGLLLFSTPFRRVSATSVNREVLRLWHWCPFHEPGRTKILACYLSRNLASSKGFLDRAVFMPRTNHTESLEWLSCMVDGTSYYSVSEASHLPYEMVDENVDTLFVWVDGDVVFQEDYTIATILRTKLEYPDSLIVLASVINEAALEHLHNHTSIALPYLPELQPTQSVDSNSWRASELPRWKGFQARTGFSPPFTNIAGFSLVTRTLATHQLACLSTQTMAQVPTNGW
ncbi:hypothetical protein BDW68DRAFT_161699 [Aspergillus falconensis]